VITLKAQPDKDVGCRTNKTHLPTARRVTRIY
jgi:hypothetical protein